MTPWFQYNLRLDPLAPMESSSPSGTVETRVNASLVPVVYLVGAIRDDHPEDIDWRQQVISALAGKAVFLNPLGGKVFHRGTKRWEMSGLDSTAAQIVRHDFWCVDHADIILANLRCLADNYPTIGSFMEIGRATARGALIYLILPPNYTGHQNSAMYRLHPFLEQTSAAQFTSVEAAITFLSRHLDVLSGARPEFDGVRLS